MSSNVELLYSTRHLQFMLIKINDLPLDLICTYTYGWKSIKPTYDTVNFCTMNICHLKIQFELTYFLPLIEKVPIIGQLSKFFFRVGIRDFFCFLGCILCIILKVAWRWKEEAGRVYYTKSDWYQNLWLRPIFCVDPSHQLE